MNWNNQNRLPSPDVGEQAMEHCDRLKIDLWRQDNGNVVAGFEIHGSIGHFDTDDDDEGSGCAQQREPTDLRLIVDLLARFQRVSGETH